MKLNGVAINQLSNSNNLEELQKNALLSNTFIDDSKNALNDINNKINKNTQVINYSSTLNDAKKIISDEVKLNIGNSENFLTEAQNKINKFIPNVNLGKEHYEKIINITSDQILNNYYELKDDEAMLSSVQAKDASFVEFLNEQRKFLTHASLDDNITNNTLSQFIDNLSNSDYAKYSSFEEREILATQFANEYNDYAIYNAIAEKPINEIYASLNEENSLINQNKNAKKMFFKNTDNIINSIKTAEAIEANQYDQMTNKLTITALEDLNNTNKVISSIDALEEIGAIDKAQKLRNEKDFFDKYNIDNPPDYIVSSEFGITGILKQINNGTMTEGDINEMLENKLISYQHADIFKKALFGNGSESYKYSNMLTKSITSKYQNNIFLGNEDENEIEQLRLTDNRAYRNKTNVSNLYESGIKQIRNDIIGGTLNSPDAINARFALLDNQVNALIINNQQNIKKVNSEILDISKIATGLENLANNNESIFDNMSVLEIEEEIKKIYG